MKQYVVTVAAGKRLIGKAMAGHPAVRSVLEKGTLVIIAGSTNGYAAEEILAATGQSEGFTRRRFVRGVTLPPAMPTTAEGRLPEDRPFPGDVVLRDGVWQKGKTIFDAADDLREGDVVLKGANALDLVRREAAILIGHPKMGTVGAALTAAVGRRVRLILPVGLEKRVPGDLSALAAILNSPGAKGARLLPVPGEVFTEIDAVALLTGAQAVLVSAGGICGAEGCCWLAVSGTTGQMAAADLLFQEVAKEPPFET
jgi:hypothetical protein